MIVSRFAHLLVPAALILALTGCEDPAKDKSKATVSSAAPVAEAKGAAKTVPAAATEDYLTIDPTSSTVSFVGSKVTGNHPGKFNTFSGTVALINGKPEGGKVKVEIDSASAKTDDEKLDGHLKSPDFFDVAKFPKATFTSTEIKAGGDKGATHTITGTLDLHGVQKTISFPATITAGGDSASATSEFTINRKDFGIVYPGMANDLIRDDVVIKLSLKAAKKKG